MNAVEKGSILAQHLRDVFQLNLQLTQEQLPLSISQDIFELIPFKVSKVARFVQDHIDPKKVPGVDLITSEELLRSTTIQLTHKFNGVFPFDYFPNSWTLSQITMILKEGKDKKLIISYRSISLLPSKG